MKKLIFSAIALLISLQAFSQAAGSVKPVPLKKVLTLKSSDYEQGNGAGVVWHPVQKKYYTARAGNISFPMDVFNATGKKLSKEGLETMADVRGLWYSGVKKTICVNCYNDGGWAAYKLNAAGIPTDVNVFVEGKNQPDENSVGAYEAAKSRVYFLQNNDIYAYNANTGVKAKEDAILNLNKGICKAYELDEDDYEDELPEFYNATMVYTGRPNQEFGLLNVNDGQIDLFSATTGMRTKVLSLPEGYKIPSYFCFAYTNGMFFLFDKENQQWNGFK